jgi:2'-5' RNA ligase
MPHMNFMFPFVPSTKFNDVRERLQKALADFPKFEVKLDRLNKFSQKKGDVTFHLATSDQKKLDELFKLVKSTLPEIPVKHPDFKAHLTLGQCKKRDFEKIVNQVTSVIDLSNFVFNVDNICIIERTQKTNDIFTVVHTIDLK